MEHVGMDLGKKESQIAILTEAGELIEADPHGARSAAGVLQGAAEGQGVDGGVDQ